MPHLVVFVEGTDDERFFRRILAPLLTAQLNIDEIHLVRHAELRKQTVDRMLRAFTALGDEYLFVADMDDAPCVSARKTALRTRHPDLDTNRIRIVRLEIESWYAAGLPSGDLATCGSADGTSNAITKEHFRVWCRSKRALPAAMMAELAETFDPSSARLLNESLDYVLTKASL